jgi:hypothetical protein
MCGHVERQDVGRDDLDIAEVARQRSQHPCEALVEFDGNYTTCPRGESNRERAEAGSHLQDFVLTAHTRRVKEPIAQLRVDEKVLSEPMPRRESMAAQKRLQLGRLSSVYQRSAISG